MCEIGFREGRKPLRSLIVPLKYISAAAFLPLLLIGAESPVVAQREIAQPLPPPAAAKLRDALTRLSREPNDLSALLDAGEAALDLNDRDAAAGFLVRAENLSPGNMRLKIALGRLRLAENRPIEALREFAEAERAGATAGVMGADRGLAFDLVGDHPSAQAAYRASLAVDDSSAVRQRLAISLAIAGDVAGFEAALLPLLQANDRAAFRTRAFGLGILGRSDEAVDIAEAMMPADMALRLAPYLRNMGRLSAPQQVAAANLGIFPRAADIGTRQIASVAEIPPRARGAEAAGNALAPSGPVMGSQPQTPPSARSETQPTSRAEPVVEAVPPTTTRRPRRGVGRTTVAEAARAPAISRSQRRRAERSRAEQEEPTPAAAETVPQSLQDDGSALSDTAGELPPAAGSTEDADATRPVTIARQEPSAADPPPPARGISTQSSQAAPQPEPQPEPVASVSVADAFADLGPAPEAIRPIGEAVDITAIEARRETPEPETPAHPARFWVQVATGRDRSALRFDWRRIARNADGILEGRGPFIASWNATNRLLAGPYDSSSEAQNVVGQLAGVGIDSFRFASAAGEVVEVLE